MTCNCYGIVCVILTYFLILFVDASMYFTEIIIFKSTTYVYVGIFNAVLLMVIWSHLQAMLNDPGVLPKNFKQLDPDTLPLSVTNLIEKASKLQDQSTSEDFATGMPDFEPSCTVKIKVSK